MKRKIFDFEHRSVKKITRQGASRRSKGGKNTEDKADLEKRCKLPKK